MGKKQEEKMRKSKLFIVILITFILNLNIHYQCLAADNLNTKTKYPDFSYEFAGKDKCENFNRKIFTFNSKVNKFVLRPINTVWASIMPKYGMDRIQNMCTNIEYPRRVTSCLLQRDLKSSGKETLRFIVNSSLGLGGMYDPAKKLFKIESKQEDMEQALAKNKVKSGPYLVLPLLPPCNTRGLAGKVLDQALNPTTYVVGPLYMAVKAGLFTNRTSYYQGLIKMLESNYADPYDVSKKLYGIDNYIRNSNLDRKEVLAEIVEAQGIPTAEEAIPDRFITAPKESNIKKPSPDIVLENYNPQSPVIDSMRTAFFEVPDLNKSMWSELSVWNRSFSKRIKTSYINIEPNRQNYKFRYILQKNPQAPVAILYPSIGEGAMAHHSVVLAKMFYDEGYSVVIQGSTFHWEFVKSVSPEYKPGLPGRDAEYARLVTKKILDKIEKEKDRKFNEKILVGTSFGAMTTLFVGALEEKKPLVNFTNYISINPPIDILYALKQFDKNTQEWNSDTSDIKSRTGIAAGKIIQVLQENSGKKPETLEIETLPFTDREAKLITSFVMQQKLSDVIFTIENASKTKKSDIYNKINNMGYSDYAQKYLKLDQYVPNQEVACSTCLYSISDFLKYNEKYKIYHSLDDYFIDSSQLNWLKNQANTKCVLFNHGGHLGFLYRREFIDEFKKDIRHKNILSNNHEIQELHTTAKVN